MIKSFIAADAAGELRVTDDAKRDRRGDNLGFRLRRDGGYGILALQC